MRIIHCADVHIGSKMTTNLSSEKAKLRKRELLDTFSRLVTYGKSKNVSAIIIAGDLFDEKNIPSSVINEVKEIIERNKSIEFLYVVGNHDEKLEEFLSTAIPKNLKVFNIPNQWTSYKIADVVFSGIDLELTTGKAFYEKLILNKDDFNIAIMHGDITKYDKDDGDNKIFLSGLKNKNIDYIALGHIHNPTREFCKLDNRGYYAYSGCLDGRGFDELGEKGFIELEIENKKIVSQQFIPFCSRQFLEISIDITNLNTYLKIEEAANAALQNTDSKHLIKLILKGKYKANVVKEKERLANNLNEQFFFCKIEDNSALDITDIDYKKDISLKGEFVRFVIKQDIPLCDKENIIALGIKALNGEEIDL